MISELRTAARLLTFRATSDELSRLGRRDLLLGLCLTWLVGIGRWWEDPKAGLLQHLGVGSVIYVFVLAFFLWLVLWPLTPPNWSFLNILIFVSLTAPPAILYAIPVRHGLELHAAQTVRLGLLGIVAGWRVALLVFYLNRGAGLSGGRLFLAATFPLLLIIATLTALNLERVVFNFMGGLQPEDRSVNDGAYGILFLLTMISMLAFLPLLAAYLFVSVNSVLAKHGQRWAKLFYGVAVGLIGTGVALIVCEQVFSGLVIGAMGIEIAVATASKPGEAKDA